MQNFHINDEEKAQKIVIQSKTIWGFVALIAFFKFKTENDSIFILPSFRLLNEIKEEKKFHLILYIEREKETILLFEHTTYLLWL